MKIKPKPAEQTIVNYLVANPRIKSFYEIERNNPNISSAGKNWLRKGILKKYDDGIGFNDKYPFDRLMRFIFENVGEENIQKLGDNPKKIKFKSQTYNDLKKNAELWDSLSISRNFKKLRK